MDANVDCLLLVKHTFFKINFDCKQLLTWEKWFSNQTSCNEHNSYPWSYEDDDSKECRYNESESPMPVMLHRQGHADSPNDLQEDKCNAAQYPSLAIRPVID